MADVSQETIPARLDMPAGPDHEAIGTLALTNPTALKAQLDGYTAARRLFLDWLFSALTAGVDYMLIHRKIGRKPNVQTCPNAKDRTARRCERCGAKATLCKPGSEKICGLLRLRPTFRRDLETWQMLGEPAGTIALVCDLLNTENRVVAEGRGVRSQELDYGDVNKTIKMVQKSAQTDAVLRCAGLSEVFTLDLEDMGGGGPTDAGAEGGDDPLGMARPQRKDAKGEGHDGDRAGDALGRGGVRERPASDDRPDPPADAARGSTRPSREPGEDGDLFATDPAAEMRARDAARPPVAPGCVSQEQIAVLMTTCRRFDVTDERLKEYLGRQYGIESKKQIKKTDLDKIIAWVADQGRPRSHPRIVRTSPRRGHCR